MQGVTLPGSHITPCGTDLRWAVGSAGFSPQDAIVMALKQQSQVGGVVQRYSCACAQCAEVATRMGFLLHKMWVVQPTVKYDGTQAAVIGGWSGAMLQLRVCTVCRSSHQDEVSVTQNVGSSAHSLQW